MLSPGAICLQLDAVYSQVMLGLGQVGTWTISRHLVQLEAMNYVTSTSTDSRLYGAEDIDPFEPLGERIALCYRQLIKPEFNSTSPTVHATKVLQSLTGAVYHGSNTAK
jgi:hypothetical protein